MAPMISSAAPNPNGYPVVMSLTVFHGVGPLPPAMCERLRERPAGDAQRAHHRADDAAPRHRFSGLTVSFIA
jgi:hypothetical protein